MGPEFTICVCLQCNPLINRQDRSLECFRKQDSDMVRCQALGGTLIEDATIQARNVRGMSIGRAFATKTITLFSGYFHGERFGWGVKLADFRLMVR